MVIVTKYIIGIALAALTLFSCNSGDSLQSYLVEKQDDDKFMKVDVATSLLETKDNTLTQEQKDILKTVKKINIVAYPLKDDNTADYDAEKEKLAAIINQEKYKTLMKMGSNNQGATLKYLGEEDAIDELIIFASDNKKGFAVFRLLGDDMRPDQMIKLMNSMDKGNIDVSPFSSIGNLFGINIDTM
jgi:acetyl/propionyl-CoA carboxylase alpha subunit